MLSHQPIAIVGAMSQEVVTLNAQLENMKTLKIAGMILNSGTLNGKSVVVMQCGIGKVNATIATTLLIQRFSPSAVINTGSAGGLADGLSVGDVVIGENVAHHDVDVTAFGYEMGQMAQMPVNYACDAMLIACAERAAVAFPNAKVHHGQIVSGDQFIANSNHFASIKEHFPQAMAVEMEACAIAQTCYRFDVPFVVIRAISDLADEQASVSFDTFIEQAGKHSAQMVTTMLEEL